MPALTFNESLHEYRLGETVLPGVTSILRAAHPMWKVDQWHLDRGKALHKAIELSLADELDDSTIDFEIAPYLKQFEDFRVKMSAKGFNSEVRCHSRQHKYAGCADLIMDIGYAKWLVDIKTGSAPKTVGMQTAAYKQALAECGIKVTRRFSLVLTPKSFRFRECEGIDDIAMFLKAREEYENQSKADSRSCYG